MFTLRLVRQAAVVLMLSSALDSLTFGQQPLPSQAGGGGHVSPAAIERERPMRELRALGEAESKLHERHSTLSNVDKETGGSTTRGAWSPLALAQIKEDFLRIQTINKALTIRRDSLGGAFDLLLIAKSTSELKKRAKRLKFNLALPDLEKGLKHSNLAVGEQPEHLKQSLAILDELVTGFVNNPMFRTPNVVDAQYSSQAQHNLTMIIELSGQIKKSCEQLSRIDQKPH